MHQKLIVTLASMALATLVCNAIASNSPTQENNLKADIARSISTTVSTPSFREIYQNTRADLAFVKRYAASQIANHFDTSMVVFLRDAQNALTARVDFLNGHGLECYGIDESLSCPEIIRNITSTFANVPQYQLNQNQLEYVKQAWLGTDRYGKSYWYPIGVENNRYYYDFENEMIVDTAEFIFSSGNTTPDLFIHVDNLRESDIFLNRDTSNPDRYEGTVDYRYPTKFSKIRNPFYFV